MARDDGKKSPLFVSSVEKAFKLLRTFGGNRQDMSLAEIADLSGLDKSSAQRFVHTLRSLGYLLQDSSTRRYSLAPQILEHAAAFLTTNPIVRTAMPFLTECHKRCEETVNLSLPIDTHMIYVARFPSIHLISVDLVIGARLPMYCTAPGRAFLAALPDSEGRRLLQRSDMQRFTDFTTVEVRPIVDQFKKVRSQGYALSNQEMFLGDISLAAAVVGRDNRPLGAVNVAVPVSRWSIDRVKAELAPIVVETAHAISSRAGR